MGKPDTINVVGEDKALEISRAIIRTHEYVLQNVAILNDRERGYMFNEYFPKVKKYLERPDDCVIPFIKDGCLGEAWKPAKEHKPLLDQFAFDKAGGQPDTVMLSAPVSEILSVRVSKDMDALYRGHSWDLLPVSGYTINKLTGELGFMMDIDTQGIMSYLGVEKRYYIFVSYKGINKPYEVGTDGE